MIEHTIRVHEIATDGLPPRDEPLSRPGTVAFIFDGGVVSGWPLYASEVAGAAHTGLWEANTDVGHGRPFAGVTHWIELPTPVWDLHEPSDGSPPPERPSTVEETLVEIAACLRPLRDYIEQKMI